MMNRDYEVYFYGRTSTKEQNEARQIEAAHEQGIDSRRIFIDKITGKTFDRPQYNLLVGTHTTAPLLRRGDLLVILSIDRLGRNYGEIMKEWRNITQEIGANIKVIDMPLLDTSKGNDSLDSRFVADLVLQILSYVANKELEANKARRDAGYKAMETQCKAVKRVSNDKARGKAAGQDKYISNKTGNAVGRPQAKYPDGWEETYQEWKAGQITATAAMKQLGLTRNTFYNLSKRYEQTA